MIDTDALRYLLEENRRFRAEIEQLTNWNQSVRVCSDHVSEIKGTDCVICEVRTLEEKRVDLNREIGERDAEIEWLRNALKQITALDMGAVRHIAEQALQTKRSAFDNPAHDPNMDIEAERAAIETIPDREGNAYREPEDESEQDSARPVHPNRSGGATAPIGDDYED